ncbi:hypothetical protein AB6N24_20610 [Cellulomonas sp. 179-A 4D5 NHS]|uniref:hypothetical protein n=1 Tax=Cellulomonas sp. 179-A 4D5 NHS TaxID=3142378 RepID=UPI0039A1E08F
MTTMFRRAARGAVTVVLDRARHRARHRDRDRDRDRVRVRVRTTLPDEGSAGSSPRRTRAARLA